MKKPSKRTIFKIILLALSLLLAAATATAVVFAVQRNRTRQELESATNQISKNNSEYSENISKKEAEYSELSDLRDFEIYSYEDKIKSESSRHQSEVDSLNKKIADLNRQLSEKIEREKKEQEGKPSQQTSAPVTPNGKTVYLTFDDGPSKHTPEILNILDSYGVKATFFVVNGKYNATMKDIVNRGHAIGLHCYEHNYSKIYSSDSAYFDDLNKISQVVENQTGVKPAIIRFPGGSSNTVSKKYNKGIMSRLSKAVTEKGYVYYDWNCANGDAAGVTDPDRLVENCKAYPKSADRIIVLMHDTKSATLKALPRIIEYYKSEGMAFAPLTPDVKPIHHSINN